MKSPAWGVPQAGNFESKVARHGAVQIKSQPAFDGTFLPPIPGFHPVWGGAAAATERAATDKTLNPVNCACTRVSREPISARSLSLLLRDRRSCLWQPSSWLPQPDFAVDFSKFAIPHAGFFNPRHGTPCRDPRHGIRNALLLLCDIALPEPCVMDWT